MTLGERLSKLRKEKGLSQEEAADKINVTRQTISKWELDQSLPDFDKIIPICKLYDITSDELLNGTEEKDNTYKDNINDKLAVEVRTKKAKIISVSLIFFVLSLIWVVAVDELFSSNTDVLVIAGFFILGTIGVINIIIGFSSLPKIEKKDTENCSHDCCHKKNKKESTIDSIIALTFLIIYLLISFITHAWHITWIIWIIFALVKQIVHLLLGIEDGDDD